MNNYIGNIISNSKSLTIDLIKNINVSNFNKNEDQVPTLIIGWNNVKKFYPDVNILNKKISDNLFWTFSKREKRSEYEKDVFLFYKYVFYCVNKSIKYVYFDILTSSLSKIKSFIKLIKSDDINIAYLNNDILYFLYKKNVIGISLKETRYLNIDDSKIIKFLKNNNIKIIDECTFLNSDTFNFIKDNNIIIPYLYNLKYGKHF